MELIARIQSKQPVFRIVDGGAVNARIEESPNIYNRKEKSLEELSRRFLRQMIDHDTHDVYLDTLTQQLDVERRRLYDIINILESLRVVSRCCKNKYTWNGFQTVYLTIQNPKLSHLEEPRGSRKEKSLEVLSVGFLRLFAESPNWTLEDAAQRLSPAGTDEAKLKTRIRRLYDIANVLKSIGLIQKIHCEKRSGYQWIGEQGLDAFQHEIRGHSKFEPCSIKRIKSNPLLLSKLSTGGQIIPPTQNVSRLLEELMKAALNRQIQDYTERKEVCLPTFHYFVQNINVLQNSGPKLLQTLTIIHPPKYTPGKLQEISKFQS